MAIVWIVSGETGTTSPVHRERYAGKPTAKAIKARLTKERAGGDRYARLELETDTSHAEPASPEDCETAMAKRGPGRPVTTGSDSTREVRFRVSAAQRAELEAEAKRLGLSSADLAARRRAFPAA